ncbi:PREDICTED: uncharacterized protein LOC106806255 [Priapulus caudatus]|uniref:Uncharacterized protein LOC106806255 n=1 Tax=Priapulus caudatus TaxID=37621 RepID=A0ABM1DUJ3_PRICU|nr:PREDICTED: uncharacterized protein LOC106806255 [Priapulus caudatus]
MGGKFTFPLVQQPAVYEPHSYFTSTGTRIRSFERTENPNPYEEIFSEFCQAMIAERRKLTAAKQIFQDADIATIAEKYPNWDASFALDMKAQFQTFDVNQDGFIDFRELCLKLDEFGDHTSEDTRRLWFDEADEDQSQGIEFWEFLKLIDNIQKGTESAAARGLADLIEHTNQGIHSMRQLNVLQQMKQGLF